MGRFGGWCAVAITFAALGLVGLALVPAFIGWSSFLCALRAGSCEKTLEFAVFSPARAAPVASSGARPASSDCGCLPGRPDNDTICRIEFKDGQIPSAAEVRDVTPLDARDAAEGAATSIRAPNYTPATRVLVVTAHKVEWPSDTWCPEKDPAWEYHGAVSVTYDRSWFR